MAVELSRNMIFSWEVKILQLIFISDKIRYNCGNSLQNAKKFLGDRKRWTRKSKPKNW